MKTSDRRAPQKGEGSISAKHVLLGDIGATNARFALLAHGTVSSLTSFDVAKYAQFADVVTAFLQGHEHTEIAKAVFAVAGPVQGSRCVLTNSSWIVDVREFNETFGLEALIVNDFEAVAYSLPSLASADVEGIGGGRAELAAPMAVLGPGSGLGVACLISGHGKNFVISSEGGHATLASANEREDEIIKRLRYRFGHVSAERLISGQGLENIYQAIIEIDGLALEFRRRAGDHEACAGKRLSGRKRSAQNLLRVFGLVCRKRGSNIWRARRSLYSRRYFATNCQLFAPIGIP